MILGLAALTACSVAPSQSGAQVRPADVAAPADAPAAPSLSGTWIIASIDGTAPPVTAYGKPPVLIFTANNYGGNAGCNDFGGLGLPHEGRWYGDFATSNQMGCGPPLGKQDEVVHGLLASGPTLAFSGADRVTLATARHRVELRRAGPAPIREAEPPRPLIGTRWTFRGLDGASIVAAARGQAPALIVEGDRFRLDTPCLTLEGDWSQTGEGRARFVPGRRTPLPCAAPARARDGAIAAAIAGEKQYATGPNGELVLAGGGHWLTGEATRRGAVDAALLAGMWQVESGPIAASRNGARPAQVLFLARSYALWDGCNRTEGLLISYERRLFTHGSGLSTLANCTAGRVDPKLKAVVTSNPRFGTLPGGGLRLVSPAGEVRLRRVGPAPASSGGVTTRLVAGQRFTFLGVHLGTLAVLPGERFRLTQPCGVTEGRYRLARGEVDGSLRFGPDRPADACQADPSARALQAVFSGNLAVAVGPNKDIALFAGRFGAVRARLTR